MLSKKSAACCEPRNNRIIGVDLLNRTVRSRLHFESVCSEIPQTVFRQHRSIATIFAPPKTDLRRRSRRRRACLMIGSATSSRRAGTHAGQTHDGADDKTGERIEPVHGRYNSARVHYCDMIRGSDCRASMLDGGALRRELRRGTVGRIPPRRISRSIPCRSICGPSMRRTFLPCANAEEGAPVLRANLGNPLAV